MVRVLVFSVALVCIAGASFYAQAQDQTGPLELRPAAPNAGPLEEPKAKPKPKPKAPPKPVAKAPEPQAQERVPALATASVKGPAAAEKPQEKPVAAEPAKAPAETRPPFDEHVIAQFCTSLSSAASDGRLAWQAKRIDEMEARLRERIAELEVKRTEVSDWLKRREDALRKADETVVAIYSKMKPDAAAAQFSAMDEFGAAAILAKLNPRMASTVLNEIDASRAARIAAEMAGVGQRRGAP